MAIKHFKINKLNLTFVFRHRFEKPDETIGKFRLHSEFRKWELGIWFKANKAVGSKDFKRPDKWKHNMVNTYMLGVNLLLCKAWVDWNIGAMEIDMGEK
jgi:hypothetical protein